MDQPTQELHLAARRASTLFGSPAPATKTLKRSVCDSARSSAPAPIQPPPPRTVISRFDDDDVQALTAAACPSAGAEEVAELAEHDVDGDPGEESGQHRHRDEAREAPARSTPARIIITPASTDSADSASGRSELENPSAPSRVGSAAAVVVVITIGRVLTARPPPIGPAIA